jgi:hypothetical protein
LAENWDLNMMRIKLMENDLMLTFGNNPSALYSEKFEYLFEEMYF